MGEEMRLILHPAVHVSAVALLYWQWFGWKAGIVALLTYWAVQSLGSMVVTLIFSENLVLIALRAKLLIVLAAFLFGAGFIHV